MSILHHTCCSRFWSFVVAAALAAAGVAPAEAQDLQGGVVKVANWPSEAERNDLSHHVLPFVDTLYVAYSYERAAERPSLALTVEWLSSGEGIIQQQRRRLDEIDGAVRMVALELDADVYVDGERAATFSVVVDSMRLDPLPAFVQVDLSDLTWSNVFADVPEEQARSIFARGFELRNPEIMHVAFAYFTRGSVGPTGDAGPSVGRPERVREVGVYPRGRGELVFDLFWLTGQRRSVRTGSSNRGIARGDGGRGSFDRDPRSRSPQTDADRSARGEGDGVGRGGGSGDGEPAAGRDEVAAGDGASGRDGATGRDGESSGSRDESRDKGDRKSRGGLFDFVNNDDDDDEDDDDKLVPYAVAAAGAAGLLAVAGGTIGYYGGAHAPYGLTSGLVRRDGGLLLQVGVNEALLSDGDGPKHLTAKLLAFGNVLNGRIQPALGGGIFATSRGADVRTEPSVSLGAVGQFGPMLFFGGYDVVQEGAEFSIALNVRRLGLFGRGDGRSD